METLSDRILARARAILTPPSAWTTGADARDAGLVRCSYSEPRAVSWCMVGALALASREIEGNATPGYAEATRRLRAAIGRPPAVEIADVNDEAGRQHSEILAFFDKALAVPAPAV